MAQTTDKRIIIETDGYEKVMHLPDNLNKLRIQDSYKDKNWKELYAQIKRELNLPDESSFVLLEKENRTNQINTADDLYDLWNTFVRNNKLKESFLRMMCLVITNEGKRMTWCPKGSNDPNFYPNMSKENWNGHLEELKQLTGTSGDGAYFQVDQSESVIKNATDLQNIWADRYKNDQPCSLQIKVVLPVVNNLKIEIEKNNSKLKPLTEKERTFVVPPIVSWKTKKRKFGVSRSF